MYDTTTDKRHCIRCKAETLGGANRPEHLCKDIAKRLARRERQVQAVLSIAPDLSRETAEDIVKALSNLGVTED